MKIKIFGINSLLKFLIIFSIFLAIINSVSANQEESIQQETQITKEGKEGSNQPVTQKSNNQHTLKQTDRATSEDTQKTIQNYSQKETETQLEQTQQELINTLKSSSSDKSQQNNEDKSFFSLIDSLIYIDLPIVLVLLLLWLLNKNQQQKQTNNLNRVINNLNKLNAIEQQANTLTSIQNEIIKLQKNNRELINSQEMLVESFNKLQSNQPVKHNFFINPASFDYSSSNLDSDQFNIHQSNYQSDNSDLNSIGIVDKIPKFVETYNQDKNSLSDKAIGTVAETQESLNQRRLGNSGTVTLKNTSQKKYWIVEEDSNYYLIPYAKINIDEYNLTTLEKLFECIDFTFNYKNFELVRPAKVTPLPSELWQLEEKGKLQFY